MADQKITDLTALTGANLATGDQFVMVDVSDTTMDATGTDKKMSAAELIAGVAVLCQIGDPHVGDARSRKSRRRLEGRPQAKPSTATTSVPRAV